MKYEKGDIIEVKCTALNAWGAFYTPVEEITSDDSKGAQKSSQAKISGMCHISQFSDAFVKDLSDYAEVGKVYRLEVLGYNEEKKQISLGYKSLYNNNETKKESLHIKESGDGFEDLSNNLSQWIDQSNDNVSESE